MIMTLVPMHLSGWGSLPWDLTAMVKAQPVKAKPTGQPAPSSSSMHLAPSRWTSDALKMMADKKEKVSDLAVGCRMV